MQTEDGPSHDLPPRSRPTQRAYPITKRPATHEQHSYFILLPKNAL